MAVVYETIASLIDAQLKILGWNQADLANVLGWSVQAVSDVMQGRRRLDAAGAIDLAVVFGIPATEFLEIQAAGELADARRETGLSERLSAIMERTQLDKRVPVRELVRRGVLPRHDVAKQRAIVLQLLEVNDLSDSPAFRVSARRQNSDDAVSRQQVAWIACARQKARRGTVASFDAEAFAELAATLSASVRSVEDLMDLPERFAVAGVRLVHVEPFPGGRIEGVSTMVDGVPMIALSGRGGRLDRVLFTLAHESAHVFLGHCSSGGICVTTDAGADTDEDEDAANDLASQWILPVDFNPGRGLFTKQRVESIAKQYGVSPPIVIGRLQKQHVIPWNSALNKAIPSVKEALSTWT